MPHPAPDRRGATATDDRSRSRLVLLVVSVAQLLVFLDALVLTVALPSIGHDLQLSVDGLQWVLNAYTIPFAGGLLLGARLADLLGQHRLLLGSLALLGVASLVGGFATTGWMLITARAVQGVAAAGLAPVTLTVITTTFPEGPERGRAIATWSAVTSAGGAAGSLLGGLITSRLDWHYALLINVPICLVIGVLAWNHIPDQRDGRRTARPDLAGAALVTLGLGTLVFTIVTGGQRGWTSSGTLVSLVVAVLVLVAFVVHEHRRRDEALLPLGVFRSRSVVVANLTMFVLGAGFFGSYYLLSLYLQDVLKLDALQVGLCFIPQTIAITVGAKVTTALTGRLGHRLVVTVGAVLAGLGFLALTRLGEQSDYLTGVLPGTVAFSLGIGLAFTPITTIAVAGAPRERSGLVSGVLNTTRQITGALAIAVFTVVLTAAGTPTEGFTTAFLVAGLLTLVAAATVWGIPVRDGEAARTS